MNINNLSQLVVMLVVVFSGTTFTSCVERVPEELPNILWLTSEDNSPLLGCYGDEFATTPNLDKMASEGFLYTHAYANAPVCAPARNTILTGVYACSNGNQHMRSRYPISDIVKPYPVYLHEAGYYCTNNSKTDYNVNNIEPNEIWDECSKTAHWKNRPEGKPFFAVFNTTISHESCIHTSIPNEKLRHNPEEVTISPYHPATPEMKHDWAQYYDKVEDMDIQIGKWLKELDDAGLSENTIVFYYGDHGGVLARSKRYVYETGTRVPFIVRIPDKYKYLFPAKKPGSKVNRLVSFVDLVPTLLSIVGIDIPEYLQGNAFLGQQKTEDPEYVYMFRGRMDERYDMCRAVRDKQFRYIRNYMPYRVCGQRLEYLFKAQSIRSWKEAYEAGKCNTVQSAFWEPKPLEELYDINNDPWEINNLVNDPKYKDVLQRLRAANKEWVLRIKDTGFIPEADRVDRDNGEPMYDYMRSDNFDLEPLVEAAEMATIGKTENIDELIRFMKNEESAIRYWGAAGLLILGEKAQPALKELKAVTNDKSANVVLAAAEALYNLGEKETAKDALLSILKIKNEFARCQALNVIDCIEENSPEIQKGVIEMIRNAGVDSLKKYDMRAAKWLIEKWGLNPEDYNIEFAWL
ncbi:sulfatase-like hydrolase/transferase [uncultured Draconibacterium sp.]|uniref:sulfatase-like hydrolase/transferase n=1 Tax=uncultured Draconibacterium sp. TaxID=1573823 RepID=UPI0029C978D1|nr:sulfatase-like hydrolase/transferase [uncultured Draconibacterium sp.]